MTDKKLEPKEQEKVTSTMGAIVEPELEHLKFVREMFDEIEKKTTPELVASLSREFFTVGLGAVRMFRKICLGASNNKAKAEAAKQVMNLFRDTGFVKNLVVLQELRGRMAKGAAEVPDNKADWISAPAKKG